MEGRLKHGVSFYQQIVSAQKTHFCHLPLRGAGGSLKKETGNCVNEKENISNSLIEQQNRCHRELYYVINCQMSHVKSMLEQIKINYQINDIGNSCCKSLVSMETKENWAVGNKADTIPKKEFLPKCCEFLKVLTKGSWKLGKNFFGSGSNGLE